MPELGPYGSVRGALSNERPYRDPYFARSRPATIRTDEDTIALVRRLAALYPDAVIAGILNRQGRTTVYGHRFEAGRVGNLRRYWNIPCFEPSAAHAEGEPLTIKTVAAVLAVAPSTLHRLLNAGIIPGEQLTPGAPWRIRLTHDVMARFNNDAGEGFMPMREAMKALGVSRSCHARQAKRTPDQSDSPATRTLRSNLMNQGAIRSGVHRHRSLTPRSPSSRRTAGPCGP